MAKRSDFTQKLLDDLRLRKEKLGFAQSSKQSAQKPNSKAHRGSQWSSRGSREATNNDFSSKSMIDTAEVTKIWLGTRYHKSPAKEGPSQDIIPFTRERRAEHRTDVSMALALELSNSGKLQNIELFSNAMVGNKRILHRGSINFREKDGQYVTNRLRSSTDQFPFLSHLQLGEISKGIQNLNKILKECSNGLSISRDSIDIGRELFKGAMDLEESLRMLLNLQEASDCMVGSQGKPVRLLKGRKEEESSSHEKRQKKLKNGTRFSFDSSSRRLRELDEEESKKNILGQNSLDLSHHEKLKVLKSSSSESSSNRSTQFLSHRRSLSCGPGSKPDAHLYSTKSKNSQKDEWRNFSDKYSSSSSKTITELGPRGSPSCERVRIPNVVARLMGLEELPLPKAEVKNSEVQRVPRPDKFTEICKTSTMDTDDYRREIDKLTYSGNCLWKPDSQNKILNEKSVVKTNIIEIPKTESSKGKPKVEELDSLDNTRVVSSYSRKSHVRIQEQIHLANQDHREEITKVKKRVAAMGGGTAIKDHDSEGKFEWSAHDAKRSTGLYTFSNHDKEISKPVLAGTKKNLIIPSKQPHTVKDNILRQQPASYRSKSKYAARESDKEIGHNTDKKSPPIVAEKSNLKQKRTDKSSHGTSTGKLLSGGSTVVASKRSSKKTDTIEQLKEYQKSSGHEEGIIGNKSSTYHKAGKEAAKQKSEENRPLKTEPGTDKEKSIPSPQVAVIKKHVHTPSTPKADTEQVIAHINEKIREEEPTKTKVLLSEGQSLKPQASILRELEQRLKEKATKTEEATEIFRPVNSEQHLEQTTVIATGQRTPLEDDCRKSAVTDHDIAGEHNGTYISSIESAAQQAPDNSHGKDLELRFSNLNENRSEGSTDSRQLSNCDPLRRKKQEFSQIDEEGLLTENECILKEIVANSEPFLSTAQVLFEFEIPIGILQARGHACPVENSKLLLDCGYEVMRRKGKIKEVTSVLKMSFASVKIRSLDALVKELNDDLKSLKVPSKHDNDEYDTTDCLHEMLERDIQNRNPDVNCMWDFDWNSITFAATERSEVARDMEKNVLDELINELTKDLFD